MSTVFIHYFSGTGNTKRAVDIIGEDLKKNGFEVKQFAIGKDKPSIQENTDFNIIAFSILSWSAASLVKRYVHRLPQGKNTKAAILAVYAGDPGHALPEMAGILKRKQFEVFLTGGVKYPNNWAQMTNPLTAAKAKEILADGDNMALEFVKSFRQGEPKFDEKGKTPGFLSRFSAFCFALYGRRFLGKAYIADSNCNRCELCIKTCPVKTIKMAGIIRKKPHWGFQCEDCARCINICPQKAIQVSMVRLLIHIIIMIVFISVCFPLAGLAARYLPSAYQMTGWMVALIIAVALLLFIQFTLIDRLLFFLEQIPALKRFFESSYTKSFNRYIAPGFKP